MGVVREHHDLLVIRFGGFSLFRLHHILNIFFWISQYLLYLNHDMRDMRLTNLRHVHTAV